MRWVIGAAGIIACGVPGGTSPVEPTDPTTVVSPPSASTTDATPTDITTTDTTTTDTTTTDTTTTGSTTHETIEPRAEAIRINEISAWNRTGPADESARYRDWIELYNPTTSALSLAGLSLTDDLDEPRSGLLDPTLQIPAGGTLLLWADGDPERGPAHLDFQLDADGEHIGLFLGDEVIDTVTYGPLPPDVSFARVPDGGPDWRVEHPTPDAPNPGSLLTDVGASDCAPVVTQAEDHLIEGDTIALTLSCTGSDTLADVAIRVIGLPPDREWDPTTGALSWQSSLANGGRYDVTFEVKPPDLAAFPETAYATTWIADAIDSPANTPVDPTRYAEEWGVPVLHIEAHGALGDTYVPMDTWFLGAPWAGQIKKRGAASFWYPKNNYTLEFEPLQADLSELGLGRKDHLVLISNFDDNAHTRQKLVYDTWAAMADWSGGDRLVPDSAFVVVYLNGVYSGLYVAIDHIDDEFIGEHGLSEAGNLYKSVSHDANFYRWNAGGGDKSTLHDGWEKKEGEPLWDFSDLEALTAWVADSTHETFAAEVDGWFVPEEFMDWFLLVHHLAADDSAGKNAYLYNDASVPWRFRYVPWDFNHALGQTWQTARQDAWSYNDFTWNNGIFSHFQSHEALADQQWARYAAMREPGGPLSEDFLVETLDTYYAQIEDSAQRDWERWEDEYRSYSGWSWRSDWTTFEEERDYLYDWVRERDVWAEASHP